MIILFYEQTADLGILAYRIVGGKGGINVGTVVNFVKSIQSLSSGPGNNDPPGILLANLGQLMWYRRGKRAVTWRTWNGLPQKNAVSGPLKTDPEKNHIPSNRNPAEHVDYIFKYVVRDLLNPTAVLDTVGVSGGANEVVEFLDNSNNWGAFGPRMNALALVAPYYAPRDFVDSNFATWLRKVRISQDCAMGLFAPSTIPPPKGRNLFTFTYTSNSVVVRIRWSIETPTAP